MSHRGERTKGGRHVKENTYELQHPASNCHRHRRQHGAGRAKTFRHAFQVPEGYAGLLYLSLKNEKAGSAEPKSHDGAS